ncbi:MAG: 16S rRNA (adenine(1518)-N(6)/adenine(1519)-N(6))-dimethyltransferase RsmA [Acidobacteriota bacterium]|nr:16S rRNA (adenine(1518)-N(6)/adenine(1519)-N(6))-dimethyltransferase RsmA [Acidobacteriota bacterium]
MAKAACDLGQPLVVEIGPGKGALTDKLLMRAERVVGIELDPALADGLESRFALKATEPHFILLRGDALTVDWTQWGSGVLAGNLPYYIASPIISRVLRLGWRAVFLIQKEVAERIVAHPGEREYGFFSVETRLFGDPELLFAVPPSAFHPPPKVESAVIRLTPRARAAELGISDPENFLRFVGRCFQYKRKTLRNNLAGSCGREIVDTWPEASMRAEQLGIEKFAELYRRASGV